MLSLIYKSVVLEYFTSFAQMGFSAVGYFNYVYYAVPIATKMRPWCPSFNFDHCQYYKVKAYSSCLQGGKLNAR